MNTVDRFSVIAIALATLGLGLGGCAGETEEDGAQASEDDELVAQGSQSVARSGCKSSDDTVLCIEDNAARTISYGSFGISPGSTVTACVSRKADGFKSCKDFVTNKADNPGFFRSLPAHFPGLESGKNYSLRVLQGGLPASQTLTFKF